MTTGWHIFCSMTKWHILCLMMTHFLLNDNKMTHLMFNYKITPPLFNDKKMTLFCLMTIWHIFLALTRWHTLCSKTTLKNQYDCLWVYLSTRDKKMWKLAIVGHHIAFNNEQTHNGSQIIKVQCYRQNSC